MLLNTLSSRENSFHPFLSPNTSRCCQRPPTLVRYKTHSFEGGADRKGTQLNDWRMERKETEANVQLVNHFDVGFEVSFGINQLGELY
jgi:hypothetical protein